MYNLTAGISDDNDSCNDKGDMTETYAVSCNMIDHFGEACVCETDGNYIQTLTG